MATIFFRSAILSSSSATIPKIKSITSIAAIFSPSAVLSSSSTASTKSSPKPPLPPLPSSKSQLSRPSSRTALAIVSTILAPTAIATAICATASPSLAYSTTTYSVYYGNSDEKGSPEYTCDVPDAWSGRLLSNDEKKPSRKDSEFYNPEQEEEKVYLTFLTDFRQLKPIENVVRRLGSYDSNVDRLIASKNSMPCKERKDENGQEYYGCEIYANKGHCWIWLAFAKNKIYAHVVIAPTLRWNRDKDMLRHIHESFKIQ